VLTLSRNVDECKTLRSGKRQKKTWKRMITKATFVGPGFTRKPPKYERFIRPSGLRQTKARAVVENKHSSDVVFLLRRTESVRASV